MIIEYEDITLRAIEKSDIDLLKNMMNDPEIENMTGGYSYPVSTYQQEKWFENLANKSEELRLIIEIKKEGSIGTIILNNIDFKNRTAELHFKILNLQELRGKGYGTNAAYALIKYAFEQLNLNCIYSKTIEYNIASQRVKEKCGFKKDGILRNRIYKNNQYHDIIVWSILKNEFNG